MFEALKPALLKLAKTQKACRYSSRPDRTPWYGNEIQNPRAYNLITLQYLSWTSGRDFCAASGLMALSRQRGYYLLLNSKLMPLREFGFFIGTSMLLAAASVWQ